MIENITTQITQSITNIEIEVDNSSIFESITISQHPISDVYLKSETDQKLLDLDLFYVKQW